jgi:N-acetylglucosamine kinase-like BadF-type ATPase
LLPYCFLQTVGGPGELSEEKSIGWSPEPDPGFSFFGSNPNLKKLYPKGSMSDYLLGIDGGGSKTAVLIARRDGTPLGRGEGGPSNYHAVGKEKAFEALDAAISQAWVDTGMHEQPVAAAVLGMAGVDRTQDSLVFEHWIAKRFRDAQVRLVNDGQIALAAGTPQGWGIVVLSGTGSIIFGQDEQGQTARAGGWGYLMGDEGSGYQAALAALQAVAKAFDGRGPATSLTQRVTAFFQAGSPPDLIAAVHQPDRTRAEIARLSRLVDEEALAGDAVAQRIINNAVGELAAGVQAVAVQKLHLDTLPAVLAGGFLVHGISLQTALLAQVKGLGITLEPVQTVEEPVRGAVKLAAKLLQIGDEIE